MTEVLRPLSVGELLDGAFTLYRRNFATFFLTALLPLSPLVLFWVVAPTFVSGVAGADMLLQVMPMLLMPYNMFAIVLLIGGLTYAAAAAHAGGRPAVGAALMEGLRRWPPLAVATILTWFLVLIGFMLLIIPGLVLLAMWFAIYPVVVLEGRGPFAAMARSRQLSKGARLRVLGVTLVAWLITLLPTLALSLFAGMSLGVAGVVSGDAWLYSGVGFTALMQAASTALSAITWPFLACVSLLLYYDRRARTEAPDLESALASLGDEVR
jgi:hypothetical protein